MVSKNMNYAFQVEYLEQAIRNHINNEELVNVLNSQGSNIIAWGNGHVKEFSSATIQKLYFKTQYPGVLIGTGYPHQTGIPTGEIQVGFSFDYVTGVPYYPGSSLKGVLRTLFDDAIQGEDDNLYLCYIRDALNETGVETADKSILREFVDLVFGNKNISGESMCGNDIFYGGFIVGFKNRIIGMDSLAPHGKDLTKAPVPIAMLRIMPEVNIVFVIDTRNNEKLNELGFSNEVRCSLYRKLLEDFGIGAKRNVGYGNLLSDEKFQYKDKKNK